MFFEYLTDIVHIELLGDIREVTGIALVFLFVLLEGDIGLTFVDREVFCEIFAYGFMYAPSLRRKVAVLIFLPLVATSLRISGVVVHVQKHLLFTLLVEESHYAEFYIDQLYQNIGLAFYAGGEGA